jgi:hypothetical protein
MKLLFSILFLLILYSGSAQNGSKHESKVAIPNGVVRIDKDKDAQTSWSNKSDIDANNPVLGNENVTYNTTSEGINIIIIGGENRIQLLALTGQSLLNGVLSQGRFFIPARKGIYILKINGKSYKVVCK